MNLLAIDCSTPIARLAIIHEGVLHEKIIDETPRHTDVILSVLQTLLQDSKITLSQLDGIIYTAGPGPFTGVRVAVAVTQALSLAHDLPTLGLSTLRIMAQTGYRLHQWQEIVVAIDARMAEIYYGFYQLQPERNVMSAVIADGLCQPPHLLLPSAGDWHGVGAARQIYESSLPENICTLPWDTEIEITMQDMLTLAMADINDTGFEQDLPMPCYLRNDVAHKKQK